MILNADSEIKVTMQAWATPAKGIALDALIKQFEDDGMTIFKVDTENNRVLVAQEES